MFYLLFKKMEFCQTYEHNLIGHTSPITKLLTRYRSVATDTKIRSSPTLTFSPSDLCFDAG